MCAFKRLKPTTTFTIQYKTIRYYLYSAKNRQDESEAQIKEQVISENNGI